VADLSVVYPIARGSAPVVSSLAAMLLLNEAPTHLGLAGLFVVSMGIILIAWPKASSGNIGKVKLGVCFGLATGLLISAYTLYDTWLIRELALAPLVIEAVSHPFRVALLWPHAHKNKAEIWKIWREHTAKVLYFAILSPIAFLMILYALKTAPVHFVAPTRELSIVVGVLLAGKLLDEQDFGKRLAGSLLMVVGVVMLALA
jgi:drug/metabolite transporter (DMT)-like permease